MKLAIAVIAYNPDQSVFYRIKEYSRLADVIVFDNSDVPALDKTNKEHITYYERSDKGNIGMSGALQRIFERCENTYDYVLTMDQDTDFKNEDIQVMMSFVEQDVENKLVGVYCPNNRKIYNGKKGIIYGPKHISKDEIKNVHFSMTSCSLVRCDILHQLNLTDLFIGYVDNELCYEVLCEGLKIKMLGFVCMNQRVGKTLNANFYNMKLHVDRLSTIRYRYMVRNNLLLQKKYKKNRDFRRELRINLIRIILNILIGEKGKLKKIKASLDGFKDFKNGKKGKIGD